MGEYLHIDYKGLGIQQFIKSTLFSSVFTAIHE